MKNLFKFSKSIFRNNCILEGCVDNKIQNVEIPSTYKGKKVCSIGTYAFAQCHIKEVIIPNTVKVLNHGAFMDCLNLEKVIIPNGIEKIDTAVFSSCVNLSYLEMPNDVKDISNFFIDRKNKLNFAYLNKTKNRIVLSENKTTDENFPYEFDIANLKKTFLDLEIVDVFTKFEILNKIVNFANKLNKCKMVIPKFMLNEIIKNNYLDYFLENNTYNIFVNELKNYNINLFDSLCYNRKTFEKLINFANAVGCFNTQKIVDQKQNVTDTMLCQKASIFFAKFLKNKDEYGDGFLDGVKITKETNQNFFKFISFESPQNYFPNLKMLFDLEKRLNTSLINFVQDNFEKIKNKRNVVNNKGLPVKISWENAIIMCLKISKYSNVEEGTEEIAECFAGKEIKQSTFDKAVKIFEYAKSKNVPHNILSEPLREENILESIEKIKNDSAIELCKSKALIDELHKKEFTFEMLDKYDPRNLILGSYCSCCAILDSDYYGSDIAHASVESTDVQNMIVKDKVGNIIAKATIYVNKELQYAVINTFAINDLYKSKEKADSYGIKTGYYNVDANNDEELTRGKIFDAFKRGVFAFVKEYDKSHYAPLRIVTVGHDHNKLRLQCDRLQLSTKNYEVPMEYSFEDADKHQYIIYDKAELDRERDFENFSKQVAELYRKRHFENFSKELQDYDENNNF